MKVLGLRFRLKKASTQLIFPGLISGEATALALVSLAAGRRLHGWMCRPLALAVPGLRVRNAATTTAGRRSRNDAAVRHGDFGPGIAVTLKSSSKYLATRYPYPSKFENLIYRTNSVT